MASKIELEAKQAQGEDVADKLAEETTKMNTNIATDTKNAGQVSIAESFDATISGGGNVAAAAANVGSSAAASNGTSDATAGNANAGKKAGKKAQLDVVDEAADDAEDDEDDADDADEED